jgi:uncharacterized protein involved in copper resistance
MRKVSWSLGLLGAAAFAVACAEPNGKTGAPPTSGSVASPADEAGHTHAPGEEHDHGKEGHDHAEQGHDHAEQGKAAEAPAPVTEHPADTTGAAPANDPFTPKAGEAPSETETPPEPAPEKAPE